MSHLRHAPERGQAKGTAPQTRDRDRFTSALPAVGLCAITRSHQTAPGGSP